MIKAKARRTIAARVVKRAREDVRPTQRALAGGGRSDVRLGKLVGWDEAGPLIDLGDGGRGPVRARVLSGVARPRPGSELAGQDVVVLVDGRSATAPVLLGLLQPFDGGAATADVEARVDGRRVELEGRDEVVLTCGQASITLRRNGRILIRGVHVETRARGVNRIKGGSVAIN
jgi:hypothetical protein